jgi:lactoylglutathione lyase
MNFMPTSGPASGPINCAQLSHHVLAIADLEVARARLLRQGINVGEPVQVPDVAYLCHFEDPDGYYIELIQHRMLDNHLAQPANENYALGTETSFSLVTCRVKNPRLSIAFYEQTLGLWLISRQQVAHRGLTPMALT